MFPDTFVSHCEKPQRCYSTKKNIRQQLLCAQKTTNIIRRQLLWPFDLFSNNSGNNLTSHRTDGSKKLEESKAAKIKLPLF